MILLSDWYQENKLLDFKWDSYYYIHAHAKNIGKLINSNGNQELYKAFNKKKKQIVGEATKTHYKNLFISNIKINENTPKYLDEVLDPNCNEKIISNIDKVLKEELQKNVNTEVIQKALENTSKNKIRGGKEKIKNDLRRTCEEINKFIENLLDMLRCFNQNQEEIMLSLKLQYNDKKSIKDYGQYLSKKIKELEQLLTKNSFKIHSAQIRSVKFSLNRIAQMLDQYEGKTTEGKDYTFDSLKTLLDNNSLSTDIMETFFLFAGDIAKNAPLYYSTNEVKQAGAEPVQIQVTDANGDFVEDNGQDVYMDTKAFGKTDVKVGNVNLSLEGILENNQQGHIKLDIGISSKFYQSKNFNINDLRANDEFSVGGGLTLEQLLNMTFSKNSELYLAYNTLAWNNDSRISQALINLQDIIFTRSIINLFASRGGRSDFAGYMVINGVIVSVWDIINYAISHNIGTSHSIASNNQAISFSLGEQRQYLTSFQNMPMPGPELRSKKVGDLIQAMHLHGYIRPAKLINALKKQDLSEITT